MLLDNKDHLKKIPKPIPRKIYNPRHSCLVEFISHSNHVYLCDTCKNTFNSIYQCWFYDKRLKVPFMRFECFDCCELIFKSPGYYNQLIDVMLENATYDFGSISKKDIAFVAKNYFVTWKQLRHFLK